MALDFSLFDTLTASSINTAWKALVKKVHPDKHKGSETATRLTQQYNEARDVLLRSLQHPAAREAEMKANDAEDERKARKKELAVRRRADLEKAACERELAEARERAEAREKEIAEAREKEIAEAREKEIAEAREKEIAEARERAEAIEKELTEAREKELADKLKEAEAQKKKTRNPRKHGSRIHRKLTSHAEGKGFVEEMQRYIVTTYHHTKTGRVTMNEIVDGFKKSRPHTTPLESNLFHRHCKRLFAETIKGAKYSKYKDKRCFMKVAKIA